MADKYHLTLEGKDPKGKEHAREVQGNREYSVGD